MKRIRFTEEQIIAVLREHEAFFLLELAPLKPSGVYQGKVQCEEQVGELWPLEYVDYQLIENGSLGLDENENEIPIPADARVVTRCLRGQILITAKSSLWNRNDEFDAYFGQHAGMNAGQIREVIEGLALAYV